MGVMPGDIARQSLWQAIIAVEGYRKANSPPEPDLISDEEMTAWYEADDDA